MFYIESERLRLIPLNLHQLRIYNHSEALAISLGLEVAKVETEPFFQTEFDDALQNYWLPKVEKNADNYVWFTNWLVVQKQENIGIGGIGLAGLPNENGESEIGYCMDLKQRGKGYATEALVCLSQWAFQNENLKIIVAHTPLDLLNSQRVLQKAGFLLIKTENELLRWELKRA